MLATAHAVTPHHWGRSPLGVRCARRLLARSRLRCAARHQFLERGLVADRIEVGVVGSERAEPLRPGDREPEVLDRVGWMLPRGAALSDTSARLVSLRAGASRKTTTAEGNRPGFRSRRSGGGRVGTRPRRTSRARANSACRVRAATRQTTTSAAVCDASRQNSRAEGGYRRRLGY
jgi:hypothetical protein